jgi:UDP-2,4-diacetamido-2,4,6-trideoxy-beta-L-altropyranose hydrolase
LGHLYRCLGFAVALKEAGHEVIFATNPEARQAVPAISANFAFIPVKGEETEQARTCGEAAGGHAAMVALDNYGLGGPFLRSCRAFADAVVVLDDTADRQGLDADVLINPNIGAEAYDYTNMVPADCRLLLGPDHALLRPSFGDLREQALARRARARGVARVLVAFGGTDPVNATSLVLDALEHSLPDVDVDVVLSSISPFLDMVRARADTRVQLHVDVDDPAPLLAAADLAIGAGGNSALERCVMGLPTVLVVIADNQDGLARALDTRGAALLAGRSDSMDAERLATILADLAGDTARLATMSSRAAELCDGRGAARIIKATLGTETPARTIGGSP